MWISVHKPAATPELHDGDSMFVTLDVDNSFPALPVHEGVDVVVRLGRTEPSSPALQVIRGTCTGRSLLP